MFRRRRATSNPATQNQPPTPSAALAASQAFLQNRTSNASLSSAAAAAALRSHSTTPEPIGNLRTKRMQRRNSQSSNGSAPVDPRPALQRRGSSGSMTERTFRSPSPNRPKSAGGKIEDTVPAAADAPPVPAIPANVSKPVPKATKRASSLDPAPPGRYSSPNPQKPSGRGQSLDSGPDTGSPQGIDANSRSSVNFSRPLSPSPKDTPPESPASTQRPKSMGGWHAGPVVRNIPDATKQRPSSMGPASVSNQALQQKIQTTANQPVKKKKKKQGINGPEGSHFVAGSMHAGPTGTAVQNGVPKQNVASSGSNAARESAPESPVSQSGPYPMIKPNKQSTAGKLAKQPSIVREDREGEEKASQIDTDQQLSSSDSAQKPSGSTRLAASAGSGGKATSEKNQQHLRVASMPITPGPNPSGGLQSDDSSPSKSSGHSPARSARFSPVPLVTARNGIRHSPPPRSVSPAKSALKHSPGSLRGTSPATSQTGGVRGTASDVSDTASQFSEDGKSVGKKKKRVRVSFDDGPVIVGIASSTTSTDHTTTARIGRPNPGEDDDSDVLKPRPMLPSFGSVRDRKSRAEEESLEKVTETVPSSMTTSISTIAEPQSTSSDHVVGGVLAQDHAAKKEKVPPPDMPLPPEVTSRDTLTCGSDTDTDESVPSPTIVPSSESPRRESLTKVQDAEAASKATLQPKPADIQPGLDVPGPAINVQPPTPAPFEEREEAVSPVPGAFPEDPIVNDAQDDAKARNRATALAYTLPDKFSSDEEIVPLTSEALQATTREASAPTSDTDDESSEGDSIYSDAAEDPSELEGGFASLDAILESPLQPLEESILSSPTDSPSTRLARKYNPTAKSPIAPKVDLTSPEPDTPASAKDWNQAKSYWSNLSEKKKREMEERANPEPGEKAVAKVRPDTVPIVAQPKPRKKKKNAVPVATPPAQPKPILQQRPRSVQSDNTPQIRQSMRSSMRPLSSESSQPPTHLRQSMRSGGTMRTSMRNSQPPPRQTTAPPAREPRGALQKKNIRPVSAGPGVLGTAVSARELAAETLRSQKPRATTFSNNSDSESSFRRRKRRDSDSTANPGRYTMKRSMRDGGPPSPPPDRSSRFRIRSLSPTPAAPTRGGMRTSMRTGSLDIGRGSEEARSPSRFSMSSFGRSKPPKAAPPPRIPPKSASRFKSRFDDSSDEDEDDAPRLAARFRSRFADSDDDSDVGSPPPLPKGLTPVRGIPKKQNDGDSTDLSDEDEPRQSVPPPAVPSSNDVEQALSSKHAQASQDIPTTNGSTGKALASGSLRKPAIETPNFKDVMPKRSESKTRRFFGLGKKKAQPTLESQKEDDETAHKTELPLGITTVIGPATPITTQRPSTPPATSQPDSKDAKNRPTSPSSPTSRPKSPKLQRRSTPQRINPDSWPLPENRRVAAAEGRPSTSDGVGRAKRERPELRTRASEGVATVDGGEGAEVVYGRRGKPKKFMALRRAFGLRD
ncbi:MAG: hypothetical protein M1820_007439 [Bogoriella megaspora]|nr:MAG: hypothetical protein M1820_007439 [Bogoriella megaspora]